MSKDLFIRADHPNIIDFPDVRQSKDYTCGVSALQAILHYYGFSYREDQLSILLHTTNQFGTHPHNIISVCRRLGLTVVVRDHMSLDEIRFYLDNQIPILTLLQSWGNPKNYQDLNINDSGHYSIIIGIIGKYIIFEDPSLIGKGYITFDTFVKRWHDADASGHQYIRYGIMIYGKDIKYDSHRIQQIK